MSFLLLYVYLGSSAGTSKGGSVVTFATFENDAPVVERCNDRHDFHQHQLKRNAIQLAKLVGSHGRPALLEAYKRAVKGAKGPCPFRALSKFDVGHYFVFDNLHNLYLGLFVSKLLLRKQSSLLLL